MKIEKKITSSQTEKLKKEIVKILSLGLDITGELVEISLERVYPEAKRLLLNSKDKRWIDVICNDKGIEVKTFQVAKNLKNISVGTAVSNVLKRVSKVNHLDENQSRRNPSDIGKDLIDYLHTTIKEHAIQKGVTGNLTMGILFRTVDKRKFAYWEQELSFGSYLDYEWSWNITTTTKGETYTIVGKKGEEYVFRWYCDNQKQLFYNYKVPNEVAFFEIEEDEVNKKAFIVTQEELDILINQEIKKRCEQFL